MRVERYIGDHQADGPVRVAIEHCLALGSIVVTVPDDVDTPFLGLERVRQVFNHHIEEYGVQGAVLGEPLHVAGVALVIDVLERDTALLHVGSGDGPVVEHLLVHALDQLVDLVDHLREADLHLLFVHLQLVDEPVHLVDEENRTDTLLERLPEYRLRLGHGSLDGVNYDDGAVNSTHSAGHVTAEVHVAGGIDHIDQVLLAAILVDHRDVACIDGDAACLFLLIGVHEELPAGEFLADHACPCEQVV